MKALGAKSLQKYNTFCDLQNISIKTFVKIEKLTKRN